MSRARPRTADTFVGASGLCMLVAGMAIISPDVRAHVNALTGDPVVHVSALVSRALDSGNMLVRAAGGYTPDSTPFMGFALVAVVLTFLMFRS